MPSPSSKKPATQIMNNDIKVGSHVTHKLTGQGMTVKRISDTVATCIKDIPEPWSSLGMVYPGDVAICLVENLILDKASNPEKE